MWTLELDGGDLESRIARAHGARACRLVAARHVPEALARLGIIRPEDRLVVCADDFKDAFTSLFEGGSVAYVDVPEPDALSAAGAVSGETFWFVNSIGCKGLRVPDLRAISARAREEGAILLVDDTVASHRCCVPLVHGASMVFESLDRVACGRLRSRCVAALVGHPVAGRGKRRRMDPFADLMMERLVGVEASRCPGIDSGDRAVVALGLEDLADRMQRHVDGARAIAEYLSAHPMVSRVRYPGLASHPDHCRVERVLSNGAGPAVDFELARLDAASFIAACPDRYRSSPAGGPCARVAARDGKSASWIRLFAGSGDPLVDIDEIERALRAR